MADSNDVAVSFSALGSGSGAILDHFRALRTALDELESELAPMLASWSGEARDAYARYKAQWEQGADSMAVLLQQIGSTVQDSHDRYRSAESRNTGYWAN